MSTDPKALADLREAICAWVRDDIPITSKLNLKPRHVDVLVAKLAALRSNPRASDSAGAENRAFLIGQRVTKISGSSWTGRIVGHYSTRFTRFSYAVESENEPGSVQIYPESALRALPLDEPCKEDRAC